ncbi:hypothetical protein [Simkania sp.]|uniref:hypothetical protein n=1 Tax=Simkania sp. TaxID=34094 RepID=UPI003B51D9EE
MEKTRTNSNAFVAEFVSQCSKYEQLTEDQFTQIISKHEGETSIEQAFAYLNASRKAYQLPPVRCGHPQKASEAYIAGTQSLRNEILLNFTPQSDPLLEILSHLGNPIHTVAHGMEKEHRLIPRLILELAKIEQVSPEVFVEKIQKHQGSNLAIKAMSYLNAERAQFNLPPIRNTDQTIDIVELYRERHEQKRNRLILCEALRIPVNSTDSPESVTKTLNN